MASNKETIEKVTNKMIERMESGKLNWNKPWNAGTLPQNYISKRAYRGWNLFVTLFSEFESPYYLTFNQIKKLGGTIKKGSKGLPIIFWKNFKKEVTNADGTKGEKSFLIARDWTVFNAEQIEGIDFKVIQLNSLGTCEELEAKINSMPEPVTIKHKTSDRACYIPMFDEIHMPLKGQFKSTEEYYATLVHETIHATGSKKRLNRESINKEGEFDSHKHAYSYEELVAELGAAYLCAMYGISNEKTEKNSAAYIQSWLKVFKSDMQMLYRASADAQKAVDYILNKEEANADEEE
jgi:antirestriction protein ArdC